MIPSVSPTDTVSKNHFQYLEIQSIEISSLAGFSQLLELVQYLGAGS